MSLFFLNLALRFCLELTVLISVGMWGWQTSEQWTRYVAAIGLPMILAIIWGVFNVPGDPSRSGNAPVVVPGIVRLLIEMVFFAAGAWALISLGYLSFCGSFIVLLIIHYLASYHRIAWLLKQ
jgi:hypothetical protein